MYMHTNTMYISMYVLDHIYLLAVFSNKPVKSKFKSLV